MSGSRNVRSRVFVGMLGGALALALTACGSSDKSGSAGSSGGAGNTAATVAVGTGPGTPEPRPLKEKTKVTVLYSAPAQSFMSLLMADHMGEFKKENLDVELKQVPTTDGAVILARGQAQVQVAGMNASAFNLLAQDPAPIKYVTTATQAQPPTEGLYVNKKYLDAAGNIDPKKIQGQPMALGIGGGGYGNPGAAAFYIQAKKLGIPLDAVRPQTVPAPVDVATAMLRGQLAGGTIFGAAYAALSKDIQDFKMVQANPPAAIFVASSKWLNDKPEVAAAFFRAIMRTNRTYLQGDYLNDPKVLDAQVQILGSTSEAVVNDGLAKYSADLDATAQKGVFPIFQEMFREAKVLSYNDELKADDVFDETPVKAVLAGKY